MDELESKTNNHKECIGFQIDDPYEAFAHMKYTIIEDYGDRCNGHYLHTWDDGKRMLCRCNNCGGYILVQKSEFHGMESDDYYVDFFPVGSPEEAERLNKEYSGFDIEFSFPKRYLAMTNRKLEWSK